MDHQKIFPTVAVPPARPDFPNVDARRWLQVVTTAEQVARDAAAGREIDPTQALALAREILTLEDWEEPITIAKRRRDDLLCSE
jgi:hypothetical protein